MRCRFKDYDGDLLSEFVDMRKHTADTLYNALLKENFTVTDILKVNRALKQLQWFVSLRQTNLPAVHRHFADYNTVSILTEWSILLRLISAVIIILLYTQWRLYMGARGAPTKNLPRQSLCPAQVIRTLVLYSCESNAACSHCLLAVSNVCDYAKNKWLISK